MIRFELSFGFDRFYHNNIFNYKDILQVLFKFHLEDSINNPSDNPFFFALINKNANKAVLTYFKLHPLNKSNLRILGKSMVFAPNGIYSDQGKIVLPFIKSIKTNGDLDLSIFGDDQLTKLSVVTTNPNTFFYKDFDIIKCIFLITTKRTLKQMITNDPNAKMFNLHKIIKEAYSLNQKIIYLFRCGKNNINTLMSEEADFLNRRLARNIAPPPDFLTQSISNYFIDDSTLWMQGIHWMMKNTIICSFEKLTPDFVYYIFLKNKSSQSCIIN